jgi:phage tail sheath protein FI
VAPLNSDEERALSFGALYHPWLGVRDDTARAQAVRFLPPDGAVAGLVAARARARGAWVAPANVPLRDVVALEPPFDEAAWARLLGRGLNLVRPLPRGFAPLSAETLAGGPLRPLGARRLLILLRRLALREGNTFAFDPHSDALRRGVAARFEGLLTRLFERGAFAGARPADAFQVRADAAVNPPEAVERGHLVAELRVAPSQPLAFLTVRLVQLDGAGLTAFEA